MYAQLPNDKVLVQGGAENIVKNYTRGIISQTQTAFTNAVRDKDSIATKVD